MTKNFEMGQKVRYARVTPEGELETGEGVVVAKMVGIGNRLNYQIKDNGKAYNLEPYALDATEEETQAYLAHVKVIRAVADEFNKKADQTIKDGNAEIDRLNTEFFGAPVEMP
jgi:hypothetical protein